MLTSNFTIPSGTWSVPLRSPVLYLKISPKETHLCSFIYRFHPSSIHSSKFYGTPLAPGSVLGIRGVEMNQAHCFVSKFMVYWRRQTEPQIMMKPVGSCPNYKTGGTKEAYKDTAPGQGGSGGEERTAWVQLRVYGICRRKHPGAHWVAEPEAAGSCRFRIWVGVIHRRWSLQPQSTHAIVISLPSTVPETPVAWPHWVVTHTNLSQEGSRVLPGIDLSVHGCNSVHVGSERDKRAASIPFYGLVCCWNT